MPRNKRNRENEQCWRNVIDTTVFSLMRTICGVYWRQVSKCDTYEKTVKSIH